MVGQSIRSNSAGVEGAPRGGRSGSRLHHRRTTEQLAHRLVVVI
jgi:hypothetical protein